MFEAKIDQGNVLKKILDAMKDLVNDANFECSANGIQLQAMDSSHVALVYLELKSDGFEHYRCDRNQSLGISLKNMSQILKCAGNDDQITMKADDNGDAVTFLCESKDQERISAFELKLMDIDSENLGIPNTAYTVVVKMPSMEFQRICRDLGTIGDTVKINTQKDGIQFSAKGDIGSGSITVKPSTDAKVDNDNDEDEDEDEENDKKKKTKKEKGKEKEKEKKGKGDQEKSAGSTSSAKEVTIVLDKPVELTFATRYLSNFAKAASLSDYVTLSLSAELPIVVEYKIDNMGYIRYYLAPKIGSDDEN